MAWGEEGKALHGSGGRAPHWGVGFLNNERKKGRESTERRGRREILRPTSLEAGPARTGPVGKKAKGSKGCASAKEKGSRPPNQGSRKEAPKAVSHSNLPMGNAAAKGREGNSMGKNVGDGPGSIIDRELPMIGKKGTDKEGRRL